MAEGNNHKMKFFSWPKEPYRAGSPSNSKFRATRSSIEVQVGPHSTRYPNPTSGMEDPHFHVYRLETLLLRLII